MQGYTLGGAVYGASEALSAVAGRKPLVEGVASGSPAHYIPYNGNNLKFSLSRILRVHFLSVPASNTSVVEPPSWIIAIIIFLATVIAGALVYIVRRLLVCYGNKRYAFVSPSLAHADAPYEIAVLCSLEPSLHLDGGGKVIWQRQDADAMHGRGFNSRMTGQSFRLDGVRTQP